MYVQQFKVAGAGYFPYDMLRYDSCFPDSQGDVVTMGIRQEQRIVGLRRYLSMKIDPTSGRWASFGWTIVPNSQQTYKV